MSHRTTCFPGIRALLAVATVSLVLAPCAAGERRLIATGWDSPTPARFRNELAAFEAWQAFDGTTIAATRKLPDGRVVDARNAFGREPWQWSEFAAALADLQAVKPVSATENFLFAYANPGDVDWFDDAGWSQIVDHWRLLARLARQAGLRGVLYDAEPYTPPHSQFLYRAQPGADEHSFAEYEAKARQRGREVMQAVADEYPDITIMTYRLFCDLLPAVESGNVSAAIQANSYGLQPGFVNGWFDVAPPTLRIVDGNEDAYRFNSPAEFNRAFVRLKLVAGGFISDEHRQKFRMQYDVGHGIYLDAHVNPPSSPWYIDRQGGTSAQRLTANVASALAASDGYVWIYGERAGGGGQAGVPSIPRGPRSSPVRIALCSARAIPSSSRTACWRTLPADRICCKRLRSMPSPARACPPAGGRGRTTSHRAYCSIRREPLTHTEWRRAYLAN